MLFTQFVEQASREQRLGVRVPAQGPSLQPVFCNSSVPGDLAWGLEGRQVQVQKSMMWTSSWRMLVHILGIAEVTTIDLKCCVSWWVWRGPPHRRTWLCKGYHCMNLGTLRKNRCWETEFACKRSHPVNYFHSNTVLLESGFYYFCLWPHIKSLSDQQNTCVFSPAAQWKALGCMLPTNRMWFVLWVTNVTRMCYYLNILRFHYPLTFFFF